MANYAVADAKIASPITTMLAHMVFQHGVRPDEAHDRLLSWTWIVMSI